MIDQQLPASPAIQPSTTLDVLGRRLAEVDGKLRAWVDLDGYFRVELHAWKVARKHYGVARSLTGALLAAFDGLARGVDLVSK
jgi:hypothetical protein